MRTSLEKSDFNREGVSPDKVRHYYRVLFLGVTREADAYLDEFIDFDIQRLQELTGKVISAILLDIDACIAPAYDDILKKNLDKIDQLRADGIGIGICSNSKAMERLNPLIERGIPIYSGKRSKPSADVFLDACTEFGFEPSTTWMVGENPTTDGGAVSVLGGMAFVKPIPAGGKDLGLKKKIMLPVQMALRRIAIWRTVIGNSDIIRSEKS